MIQLIEILNVQKIIAIVLIVFNLAPRVFAAGFTDVPITHVNYKAIIDLQKRGIISGYSDNTYRPLQPINRAEALKIILLGSGINTSNAAGIDNFNDTQKNVWYSQFLIKALAVGVIQGYPDNTFRPGQTVNLVEALKILLLTNSIDLTKVQVAQNIYADIIPGSWYLKYLQYAKNNSLIDPAPGNKIYPAQPITRGKLAEIIYRLIMRYQGLLPAQKDRAEALTSLFEDGSTTVRYDATTNLGDGRGITAGRAGFTTATGDAYEVVKRYTERASSNLLTKYLPELQRLADEQSDDTSNLVGFEAAWKKAAEDPMFKTVQDDVVDDLYFRPAMKMADDLGLILPLSRAVLYDTIIQHGGGNDPDGLPAIIERTNSVMGGSPVNGLDEKVWLNEFLQTRIADLTDPYNSASKEIWALSVTRCVVFLQIASEGNYNLNAPILIDTNDYHETIF